MRIVTRLLDSKRKWILHVYFSYYDGYVLANVLFTFCSYVVPTALALVAYVLRLIVDLTCSSWSTVCRGGSDFLSHLFAVVVCFMVLLAATKAQQVKAFLGRLKAAIQLLMLDGKEKKD